MRRSYLHLLGGVLFSLPLLFASCGNGDNALEEIINGGGSGGSTAVTEITIDLTAIADEYLNDEKTQLNLKVGDEVPLSFIIKPDGLTDADVTLTSDDPTIVNIDGKKVKALKSGTTKVTAKAGDKSATCPVTVTEPYTAKQYKKYTVNGDNSITPSKETAPSDPIEIANDYTGTIASDWYTVTGDNVSISGQTLTGDVHLILCDGAKLTINGTLQAGNYNLYIYGQGKGDGKLNVTNSNNHAIYGSSADGKVIEIHGGEITAAATGYGLYAKGIKVYGGKLTATAAGESSSIFFENGGFDVYGGEVEATNTNISSSLGLYGISGGINNNILTVYGGKVKGTGNGKGSSTYYGCGFKCKVKSENGIKFYFSDDNSTWDDSGNPYDGTTAAPKKRYAKAEKVVSE